MRCEVERREAERGEEVTTGRDCSVTELVYVEDIGSSAAAAYKTGEEGQSMLEEKEREGERSTHVVAPHVASRGRELGGSATDRIDVRACERMG